MRKLKVTFPSGAERLAGTLLVPEGRGSFPAVVLVHGLGSGGKAMQPVAHELARLGLAALAFDQRGHGRSTGVYDGDTSDDILAAAGFLAGLPEVDPSRIAVVGHSSGAREAIIACLKSPHLAALVCTSSPADGAPVNTNGFYRRIRFRKGVVSEYPRDGALPWLEGRSLRTTSWAWSRLQGYRLRVRWQETLVQWGRLRPSFAIQEMAPRPLLLVHCQGDKAVPSLASEVLYQKASEPKELFIAPGGWHSTPLLPGPVRRKWTSWLAVLLHPEPVEGAEAKHGVAP